MVTGAGSTWSNSSGVNIGNLGTGTLTIADGGIVTACYDRDEPPVRLEHSTSARARAIRRLHPARSRRRASHLAPAPVRSTSITRPPTTCLRRRSAATAPSMCSPAPPRSPLPTATVDATNVNAGTLRAGATNTFSPNSPVTVAGGGTLDLNGFSQTVPSVTNAGLVNMGTGTAPGTLLTTTNYTGTGGTIAMNTFLGADNSPSDKLVINGGSATGSSFLRITNAGGPGAQTVANGIQVVQAINGGTSASGAFSLPGGSITAGAFDYFLFKGGASPGSEGNWYLRSTLIAPVTPDVPPPEAAPGTPPLPTPVPGAAPIPLFQPGVAVMSVVPSVARTLGLLTLATFNERQGDQLLVRDGTKIGAWGRMFGQNTREHFAQGARPDFDGSFAGFQAGADLWRLESSNGHHDNIGFYVAQARASGTVHGSVDGLEGALAGHVDLDASSYGGYWTHLGPSNWYIDTVVQGTHFIGTPQSIRGVSTRVNGDAFAGSIEAGYPIALAPWLIFEPQVQGIWQRVWLDQALVPLRPSRSTAPTCSRGARARCCGEFWQRRRAVAALSEG